MALEMKYIVEKLMLDLVHSTLGCSGSLLTWSPSMVLDSSELNGEFNGGKRKISSFQVDLQNQHRISV